MELSPTDEIKKVILQIHPNSFMWDNKKPQPMNVFPYSYDKGLFRPFNEINIVGSSLSCILHELRINLEKLKDPMGALVLKEKPIFKNSKMFGYLLRITFCYIPNKYCKDKFGKPLVKRII